MKTWYVSLGWYPARPAMPFYSHEDQGTAIKYALADAGNRRSISLRNLIALDPDGEKNYIEGSVRNFYLSDHVDPDEGFVIYDPVQSEDPAQWEYLGFVYLSDSTK